MADDAPRMYTDLAPWFHLLTAPPQYVEEAATFVELISSRANRDVRQVLELGSGGGNNASHLKERFEMTLVDLSPDMLAVSRSINPELEHLQGDMRTIRLGRTFDAVLIHDAIGYMATTGDLGAAIGTAAAHVRPGGVALLVPDETTESYRPRTMCGGDDGPDGRAMRYLQWSHEPEGGTATTTFVYAFVEDGELRVEHERHVFGLFPTATWLGLIRDAGLEPEAVPFEHSEFGPDDERVIFIGVAP